IDDLEDCALGRQGYHALGQVGDRVVGENPRLEDAPVQAAVGGKRIQLVNCATELGEYPASGQRVLVNGDVAVGDRNDERLPFLDGLAEVDRDQRPCIASGYRAAGHELRIVDVAERGVHRPMQPLYVGCVILADSYTPLALARPGTVD